MINLDACFDIKADRFTCTFLTAQVCMPALSAFSGLALTVCKLREDLSTEPRYIPPGSQ